MAFFKKTKQTEKTMSYADYEVIEELKAKGTSMTAKDKFDIAERYSHNEFDTEDEERSLSWYITAWNSGYKEALSSIKRYAQKGYIRAMKVVSDTLPADSVDKDAKELFNKVFKYYKKLVDKENCNNGEAFMSVADCYFYGKGTNRNYAEAFKKYSRAADFKYPGANMKVGEMYEFGYGTGVEPRLAFDRYKLAFNEGYEKVSDAIYRLSATSDGWLITSCASFFLEQNEYKKVISILENYVRETKSKYAVGLLGSAYTRTGEKENIEKALEIYRQAALDGDEASGLNLGEIYEAGKLVPQDLEKAVDWYFHSAKNGLSLSIIPLKPPFHYEGLCRIFDLAFEGSDYAVKKIAFCFFDGFGTDVDHEKA